MFEKPMGIWAILEEESLFPKATDKSFEEKLKASLGKLPVFLKPASKTDKNAHFGISHYAGVVRRFDPIFNVDPLLLLRSERVRARAICTRTRDPRFIAIFFFFSILCLIA